MNNIISISDTYCTFNNIKEIKFTKVQDDLFMLTIDSDIEIQDKNLEESEFKAQLCKIDPTLHLKIENEYTDVPPFGGIVSSQCFSLPINVKLISDKQLNEIFKIKLNEKK